MKTILSKADYTEAMSHDLAEKFEIFVQQTHYLEVDEVTSGFVARYVRFKNGSGVYNMSCVYALNSRKEYTIDLAIADDDAVETFYRYDTLQDAKDHAFELMTDCTDDGL